MSKRPIKRAALPKTSYEALADFRYAIRQFLAFSEEAAGAAGLTPQQHQVLLAIKGSRAGDALGIQELASRLLLRHHSVVEQVDRLEARALVRRVPDPSDGRRVKVQLTPKAERLLQTLSIAHLDELRSIKPAFQTLIEQFD
jgi:DNA-binding MarR family transcriptional regulator